MALAEKLAGGGDLKMWSMCPAGPFMRSSKVKCLTALAAEPCGGLCKAHASILCVLEASSELMVWSMCPAGPFMTSKVKLLTVLAAEPCGGLCKV